MSKIEIWKLSAYQQYLYYIVYTDSKKHLTANFSKANRDGWQMLVLTATPTSDVCIKKWNERFIYVVCWNVDRKYWKHQTGQTASVESKADKSLLTWSSWVLFFSVIFINYYLNLYQMSYRKVNVSIYKVSFLNHFHNTSSVIAIVCEHVLYTQNGSRKGDGYVDKCFYVRHNVHNIRTLMFHVLTR